MKIKKEFKVVLVDQSQFLQAWDALLILGYYVENLPNPTPNYLIAKSDGRIGFEIQAADLKEVTISELVTMVRQLKFENALYEQERPLFEATFKRLGGSLIYLLWGGGGRRYVVDKSSSKESEIKGSEFDVEIQAHAEYVTDCLHAWIEASKLKKIPDGSMLASN